MRAEAFFHQDARGLFIAQAVAGLQRVVQMQADFIFVAQGRRDTALRVLRVGSVTSCLARHSTRPAEASSHRSSQTCNAGANNDEVGISTADISWDALGDLNPPESTVPMVIYHASTLSTQAEAASSREKGTL